MRPDLQLRIIQFYLLFLDSFFINTDFQLPDLIFQFLQQPARILKLLIQVVRIKTASILKSLNTL